MVKVVVVVDVPNWHIIRLWSSPALHRLHQRDQGGALNIIIINWNCLDRRRRLCHGQKLDLEQMQWGQVFFLVFHRRILRRISRNEKNIQNFIPRWLMLTPMVVIEETTPHLSTFPRRLQHNVNLDVVCVCVNKWSAGECNLRFSEIVNFIVYNIDSRALRDRRISTANFVLITRKLSKILQFIAATKEESSDGRKQQQA